MKILHINNFSYPDYQNDMVFLGGRSVFGGNYEPSSKPNYLLQSYKPRKASLYGRGFTLYCQLPEVEAGTEVDRKIADHHYDRIVVGSVFRLDGSDLNLWNLVKQYYAKSEVALIDGEDHNGIYWEMCKYGTYFKRELVGNNGLIHPLGFGVPAAMYGGNCPKSKDFATVVPGHADTYIFTDEHSYYQDYQQSYFGLTRKKAGWDCLRHYEIMMNWCFPAFSDLQDCPPETLHHFPKKLVLDYLHKYGPTFSPEYWETMDKIMYHASQYCTTEAIIKYILERLR